MRGSPPPLLQEGSYAFPSYVRPARLRSVIGRSADPLRRPLVVSVHLGTWWVFRAHECDASIGGATSSHWHHRRVLGGIHPSFHCVIALHENDAVKLGTIVDRNADASPLPTSGWRQGGLQALTH